MSKIKHIILLLPLIILQTGCIDLFPNTEKESYSATVTLQKEEETPYFITDDDNITLTTINKLDDVKDKIGNRFYISYTINNKYSETQYEISLSSILELNKKDIVTSDYTSNKEDYCIPKLVWVSGKHLNCIITCSISDSKKHEFLMIYKNIDPETGTLSLKLIHNNDKDKEYTNKDFAFTYNIEEYIKNNDIKNISITYQDKYKGSDTISIKIK